MVPDRQTVVRALLVRAVAFLALWLILAGVKTADFPAALTAVAAAVWASIRLMPPGTIQLSPTGIVRLAARFPLEALVAGIDVARRAFAPRLPLRPGLVSCPSRQPPGPAREAFLMFASLLPGTVPCDESNDQRLLVHSVDVTQPIAAQAPALDRARGAALDTPLGSLLGDYLVLLEQILPDVAPDDQPRISDAIGAMVAARLAPEQDRAGCAGPQIDLVRLERVRRVVRKYLRSPSLGTRLLCHSLSVSRSKLYRLMDAEGGVARYIQRQRLLEAYALFSDQSVNKSITAIAEELCFADTSGFSRAFRREFGVSPSDVRAGGRSAPNASMACAQGGGAKGGSLNSLLRTI